MNRRLAVLILLLFPGFLFADERIWSEVIPAWRSNFTAMSEKQGSYEVNGKSVAFFGRDGRFLTELNGLAVGSNGRYGYATRDGRIESLTHGSAKADEQASRFRAPYLASCSLFLKDGIGVPLYEFPRELYPDATMRDLGDGRYEIVFSKPKGNTITVTAESANHWRVVEWRIDTPKGSYSGSTGYHGDTIYPRELRSGPVTVTASRPEPCNKPASSFDIEERGVIPPSNYARPKSNLPYAVGSIVVLCLVLALAWRRKGLIAASVALVLVSSYGYPVI